MPQLVLIRHGESTWNLENRFTGWTDVPLTPTGVAQACEAGRLLKDGGFEFDVAYTSVLKRAIWPLWHALDAMDRSWLPIVNDWRHCSTCASPNWRAMSALFKPCRAP